VILYADRETNSIRETMSETNRRRELQRRYNDEHGITPQTIVKRISSLRDSIWEQDYVTVPAATQEPEASIPLHELPELIDSLSREMREAARELDFERAAVLRDRLQELEAERLRVS
jgi:excinuclease ABC subunit B